MDDSRNLVRVGIVSSVDANALKARVYYPQLDNLVSDWIPVLQHPLITSTEVSGAHAHAGTAGSDGAHDHAGEVTSDGAHEHAVATDTAQEHAHGLTIVGWMPAVNDRVLVLYAQGFSTDGFILGVIL
jgi:hypothetical protein